MSCQDCVNGVIHEGVAEGKIEQIGGVECYVATPSGDYPKDKVVLIMTDVFGLALVNNKLLADSFARSGLKTVMPDLFNGDPLKDEHLNSTTFDRAGWMAKHGTDSWTPLVDNVVAALKTEGVTRLGATGYCFGAPPSLYLAFSNTTHATALAHPSRMEIPGDLEKYRDVSKAPLLINSCEVDQAFPAEAQKTADEILGNGKFAPGYERLYWDGCTHGFAVRGDLSNPKVKAGKEGAFTATVELFRKHL